MAITVHPGTLNELEEIVDAVSTWQVEGSPVQLHPGDLGWNAGSGAQELANSLWVWRRGGQILAAGTGESGMLRMALAPSVDHDEAFAARLVQDLSDPARGVFPEGQGQVEARFGTEFRGLLRRGGWSADESWTPLRRALSTPVDDCGLRIESIDGRALRDRHRLDHALRERVVRDRVAVQRASFANSAFTLERWQAMAASPTYQRGRCLVAYDADDHPVAATTVWAAGPGRKGLIEPLGTHTAHRGHGYGRAITLAAAAALRELDASSVTVCTRTANVGAIATYVSAGFERLPAVTDFRGPA